MKKRPAREISVFNLSMLDVIFSALGAVLILFIIKLEYTSTVEAKLNKTQKGLANANEQIDDMVRSVEDQSKQIKKLEQELSQNKEQAEKLAQINDELEKKVKKLKRRGRGMSMGMCQVNAPGEVRLTFYDHGSIDGDRVKLEWNEDILHSNLELGDLPGRTFVVQVEEEDNYLNITALNEGSSPPNTDTIVVAPCKNGRPQSFKWEMNTGDKQFLSIEGI